MSERNSVFQPPAEPVGTLSAENLETLAYLHRAIELADDFALLFARCDQPAQRDVLIARLGERLSCEGHYARRLDVRPLSTSLLTALQAVCRPTSERNRPACVHVCGLEDTLPPHDPDPPMLRHLNLARDHFRNLPCPLVIWLPDAALTRLAQGAPDFWAWRSSTFDFVPAWILPEEHLEAYPPVSRATAQAEERILAIEGLLEEYRTLPDGPTERRARANLLVNLADLYQATWRPHMARQRLKEAMPLVRSLKDQVLKSQARDLLRSLDADLGTKEP